MRYRTIVADPPWRYGKAGGYSWREGRVSGDARPMLAYRTMSVEEIAALPVSEWAEDDAALFVFGAPANTSARGSSYGQA